MSKKILVVDDEELVTRTMLKFLKVNGYTVFIAKSGEEALAEIKKTEIDLIISDVRMPGLDVIETIKRIRKYLEETNRKHIPEVLITGYADMDKYEKANDLEVSDYLYKPFDNDEFLRIVRKALGEDAPK